MQKVNVIDIGAVGGLDIPWSSHRNKVGRVLSFEPNETPILTGRQLRYNCAIWNFDGEATFYTSGKDGVGSSLLKQNIDWVRENLAGIKLEGNQALNNSWFDRATVTKKFTCKVKKLDTVLLELYKSLGEKITFPFLKSDTQSGERFVLEGAESYLHNDCVGLELELFRYPLYQDIILEDQVKDHLKTLGFQVAGWTGYKSSFNSQADYLFLRETPRSEEEKILISLIESVYKPVGAEKLIKLPSIKNRITSKLKVAVRGLFPS